MTQVFKIGDRAMPTGGDCFSERKGKVGTVVYIEGSYGIHIKFDDDSLNINVHTFHEGEKCFYYHASNLVDISLISSVPSSVKDTMVKTLIELTDEQQDSLSPEDRALVELGVVNDKLVLIDTSYVITQYYKANKKAIATQAIEDVKKIKGEIIKKAK